MSVRTGMFPPPSVGPMAPGMPGMPGMPGPMPPMSGAPNPFAPMPPMPLAGMPPPPPMGGMPPPPISSSNSRGLGSVSGSNAPRRRMFGDFLESKLSSGQPRSAPQMARPPQMQQQQRMVAPGTPAMRTPPMQSMMPRPMMYGGEVDVFGYEDGGEAISSGGIGPDAYVGPNDGPVFQVVNPGPASGVEIVSKELSNPAQDFLNKFNSVVSQPVSSITGSAFGSGGNLGSGSYTADYVDSSAVNPIDYNQFTGDVGKFSNTGENFSLYGPQVNIPQSVSQYMTGPSGGLTTTNGPDMSSVGGIGALNMPASPVDLDVLNWLSAPTYGSLDRPVNEMEDGGAVPRQTMIGDDPHMLAYINPEEAQLLKDLGGTGEPGPGGIPAYRPSDFAAERTGTGAYSHATDNDDDNKTSSSVAAANKAAAESMLSAGVSNVGGNSATDFINKNDDNDDVDDVFGTGNIFTEETPGASIVDFGTGSSGSDDKTYTDTSSIAGISDASGVDYNAGGSGGGGGDTTVYTPPPVYVPPVYTDSRGRTYDSQAEADAANRAIDAFNTQLMSYGAGNEAFNRFADKVKAQVPYASREDSDRAASQIYSTRFTPELAGYSGPDILGGIYSNIAGIGSSDLGTDDGVGNLTAQPIVDANVDTSQSPSQQLDQYGIDDDVFNFNPEEDTLSQAVRADVGQDYTPTSAELAAQLANANLPDLRLSQFDVDMSQPKTPNRTTLGALHEIDVIRKETEEKFARDGDQSYYDESMAALDNIERQALERPFDKADGGREIRTKFSPRDSLRDQIAAGDFDGTILGEGEGGMPQRNLDLADTGRQLQNNEITEADINEMILAGANSRPADAGLGRGAGFKSLDQLKADISKVEGTDDDAGYNRLLDRGETGTFSGNKPLTEMTVAEAIAFGTSDAYRNYSRDVLGRGPNELPSTPMGKYQIVGTTLKDLVDRGLIDPNAQFDADTQEQIGSLLVKNRGYDDVLSGKITEEQFLSNLGNEFEGVKKNKNFNLSGGSVNQTGINQVSDAAQELADKNKAIYDRGLGSDDDPRRGNLSVNAAEAKYLQNLLSTLEFNDEGKLVDKDPNFIEDVFNKLVRNFTLGLVDINDLNKNKVQEVLDAYKKTGSFVYDTEGNAIDLKTVEDLEKLEKLSAGEGQNPAVIGVRNEDGETVSEDGETVSFGSDIANTSEGPVAVDDDIFATIATSGDDDTTTTTTDVDTGYTTDENGNKICNQAGYVYDVATDACVPVVAEEESTDTSLNIGSGASRSFEDVLKNIQTKPTTIAPISANIKPMAQGGMAGLNRTADNFLRALGG